MKFVGIDVGTTTIGGVLFDPESRAVIDVIVEPNHALLDSVHPWERLQDPRLILETVTAICDTFASRYPDIRGIGVTGQMHGITYLDRAGNAVAPLYSWQDGRGDLLFEDGTTYAGYLSARSGYRMATGFGLTTHFYNSIHGLVPDEASVLCTIPDYIAMKLANRNSPICDPTHAASLGLFDLKNVCFDPAAMTKVGINPALLPQLGTALKTMGQTESGIAVFPAVGDNQASFIGAVKDLRISILANIGTSSQLSAYTADYVGVSRNELRPFPGGGYILVGAPLCGGRSYALLEAFFKDCIRVFTGQSCGDLYETMNRIDYEAIPEEERLQVATQFSGTRQDPDKRGVIRNIGVANFTPAHLIAGFLDGIVAELLEFYAELPDAMKRKSRILLGAGNGIRKNELLQKILRQKFQMDLQIPAGREEASHGAALVAAVGCGCFPDLCTAMNLSNVQESKGM